jgi:hypothetical protein
MRTRRCAIALALLATAGRAGGSFASCREHVFSGLAGDCNLNAGGSVGACCRRLAATESERCFCDPNIFSAVLAAVGPEGVRFFATFARANCSFALTQGAECPVPPPALPAAAIPTPGPPPVPQVVAPPRAPQVRLCAGCARSAAPAADCAVR